MKVNKDQLQMVQMQKGHRVIKQEKSFEFAFAMKILKKNKNRNKMKGQILTYIRIN